MHRSSRKPCRISTLALALLLSFSIAVPVAAATPTSDDPTAAPQVIRALSKGRIDRPAPPRAESAERVQVVRRALAGEVGRRTSGAAGRSLAGAGGPATSAVAADLVFGADDRRRVADTTALPYRNVAFVVSQFPQGQPLAFSGVLIGPYTVLTAAEALYQASRGGYALSVEVTPGQFEEGSQIRRPFGTRAAAFLEVPQEWIDTESLASNFGVALLDQPFSGFTEHFSVGLDFVPAGQFSITGYDEKPSGGQPSFDQWHRSGTVEEIADAFFFHRLDDDEGAIGAPAWTTDGENGGALAFGLECCIASDASANAGVYFPGELQELFEDWVSYLPATTIEPDPLELQPGGRFEVRVWWRTDTGEEGAGTPISLTTDSGYFWFFTDTNVELIVKVLDACGFGNRFWVFAGGLTNVEVVIEVTDTDTGAIRTYFNPLGVPFQPLQDTDAFDTCS